MTAGIPVTPETRTEILRLFDAGTSRNGIARQLKVSTGVVSRICKDAGREFDRAATAQATAARSIDLAAVRLELAEQMSAAGLELLKARHDPYLVYNFGGKDNDYNEHTLEQAPVEVIRNAVTTAAIAFDKVSKVVDEQANPGEVGAKAMLAKLGEAMGVS